MADFHRNGLADRDIEQAITALKKGTYLLKYRRRGKPKFCLFQLSNDESKLKWYSGKKEKHVKLKEVSKIIPGQRTAIFQRYPRPEKEYQSFSLILTDRSLDLICKDKDEAEIWLTGLKSLIPGGTYSKWRTEVVNGNSSIDSSLPINLKNSPNSPSDSEDAQGIQAPYEAHNRLGKAFADIITHTAATKSFTEQYLVDSSLVSAASVENSNSRCSGADLIRVSLSSAVSSSSHSSSREDSDALGDVFIWGQGTSNGVLGGGTNKVGNSFNAEMDALLPKQLVSTVVLDVTNIACGSRHAVLVTRQGEIFSWGEESGGRLGHGVEADVLKPKLINTLSGINFETVACGEYHTCAITSSRDLFTWGDGTHNLGLLGHGTDVSHWTPKRVCYMEGIQVSYISCGPWHTALVTYGGQLFTFGDGSFGALGHGDYRSSTIPREVETLSGFQTTRVACGAWHTAAVVKVVSESYDSGSPDNSSSVKLFTWGDGNKGQLGHGDNKPRLFPECVDACFDGICQVACGYNLTVALTTSGRVYTMGSSAYGQLGSATADGKVPTLVEGKIVNNFVEEIACGSYHVAILTSKTKVYTWGKGTNGQLGHGDINDRNTPTLVDFLKDKQVKSVACGSNFTAIISLHKLVSGLDQSVCFGCRNPFGFRRKRHNCYNCGLIFCKSCTSRKAFKASMAPSTSKPYRVCDECFSKLRKASESAFAVWASKAKNGILPRKSTDIESLKLQTDFSRLSVDSTYHAESRNAKHELKLESQTRLLFPHQSGKFNLGGFYSPKASNSPVKDSKNILPPPTSSSKRTSRATSPASGKLSPNQSSEVIFDDSKQINDSLNQEIINLRAQVEDLASKAKHFEAEFRKTSKKLKEVSSIAENEAKKYKSAKEVIRSLTAQLKEATAIVPVGKNALQNSKSTAKNTEHILSDNSHAASITLPHNEVSSNLENVPLHSETKGKIEKSETVIQDEPGVYLTLSPLPDGGNELKRVRFSRKHFTEERAESWWAENGDKVCERHNIQNAYHL